MNDISKDKLILELESNNKELRLMLFKYQEEVNNRKIELAELKYKVFDEKLVIEDELICIRLYYPNKTKQHFKKPYLKYAKISTINKRVET